MLIIRILICTDTREEGPLGNPLQIDSTDKKKDQRVP